jgi:hypothetical protein
LGSQRCRPSSDLEGARLTAEEPLLKEYYEIVRIVGEFDGRLMTVKGWGVTLSLAALAWGFQYGRYGLFLVSSLSGLAFWIIEGTMKRHQMRYYLRMRKIEVLQYQRCADDSARTASSPRIDSSWSYAGILYTRGGSSASHPVAVHGPRRSYRLAWFFPHVFLPHLLSVVAGLLLLVLGYRGLLGGMQW